MGLVGFGLAGALVVAATEASHVAQSVGLTNLGPAQKIPASLAKRLHHVSSPSSSSTNWGGYADTATAGTILESYGVWQVPSISCSSAYPAINDNWVGIDGFGTGTVEQGGTYGYCTSTGAGPYYWTWWEFFPYNGIQSFSSSVSAGDWIEAYILFNPQFCYGSACGVYTIVVNDLSNSAADLSVVGNPTTCNPSNGACESGSDSTVECISESLVDQGYYLPDYGTTTFATCDATVNGHYAGIGGLPSSAGATVYKVATIGFLSGLTQQKISSLTSFDYHKDHFVITWKRYD
jgi:hypothetical protein